MKNPTSRYAAWCRRQASAQCSPAGVGLGVVIIVCVVFSAQIGHEAVIHKTGITQILDGIGAGLICLAAAALVVTAMRIVDRTPVPVTPAPDVLTGRKPAVVTSIALRPEERAEMEAEAELLAKDDVSLVVSGNGAVYGLMDEPEPEDAS